MVKRKRVTGRTIWQPVLIVSILVMILFTPFTGTGATTALNRAFLDAALNGDTKAVEALLAEGADVNVKDGIGFTALFGAARSGHNETVKLLLDFPGLYKYVLVDPCNTKRFDKSFDPL